MLSMPDNWASSAIITRVKPEVANYSKLPNGMSSLYLTQCSLCIKINDVYMSRPNSVYIIKTFFLYINILEQIPIRRQMIYSKSQKS